MNKTVVPGKEADNPVLANRLAKEQLIKGIKENSPFKMWIKHEVGMLPDSNTLPICPISKLKAVPNMKWAMGFIKRYQPKPKFVIFYENGVEFGTYDGFRYNGQYSNFI